jgi:hypothetical protein
MVGIRPADEYRASGLMAYARVHTRYTLLKMAETFRVHGPSTFTASALHHTLAVLLKPFGIHNNDGKPYTTDAIKKLLRRHSETNIHRGDN